MRILYSGISAGTEMTAYRGSNPYLVKRWESERRLFLIDAESGETREVTPQGVNVFEFDWSGGKVAAVCTDDPSESAWYDAYVARLDLASGAVERL